MKKSELRQLIREVIKEQGDTYYEVDYYARVGEHGSIGNWPDMNTAYKKAIDLYKREKKANQLGEDTWYIGVSGNSDDFAIIYVDAQYLKNRISAQDFGDATAYKNWLKVAKQVLKSGKPAKGTYS